MCIDAIAGRIGSEGLVYGVGYTLYNIGGSVGVGIYRAYESIKELANFYSKVDAYESAKDLRGVYKDHVGAKYLGHSYPEEVRDFWWGQLVRSATEIFLPIIASVAWTLRDLYVTFVSEKDATRQNFRADIGRNHAEQSPFQDAIRTNVFGRSEMAEMLAWRAAVDGLALYHNAQKHGV